MFDAKPEDVVASACKLGLEGVIAKRRNSAYVNRRSTDWIKLKCTQRQEFVIGGWTDPQGSRTGIGSLLLGGVLTDLLDWRWVFFVNVPIGVLAMAGTLVLKEGERNRGRLDIPGALTATAGLLALVYGITRGGEHGWTDPATLGCFAAAAALLAGFLQWQRRAAAPMMPLRLFADREFAAANIVTLVMYAALGGAFGSGAVFTASWSMGADWEARMPIRLLRFGVAALLLAAALVTGLSARGLL